MVWIGEVGEEGEVSIEVERWEEDNGIEASVWDVESRVSGLDEEKDDENEDAREDEEKAEEEAKDSTTPN